MTSVIGTNGTDRGIFGDTITGVVDAVTEVNGDAARLHQPTPSQIENLQRILDPDDHLSEPELEPVVGIFEDESDLFTKYRVSIRFVDRVLGGQPKRADIVEAWMRKNMQLSDEDELREKVRLHLVEMGVNVPSDATYAEMVEISKRIVDQTHANGFKRDGDGVYLEERQVKAMLKEASNVLFAGDRWGRTKKGPKSAMAEWVFVDELRLHFGKPDPDGVHLMIGHVTGPQGPRSTLTLFEYLRQPSLTFTVRSVEDRVQPDQWRKMLRYAQFNGLGAVRSQGFGRFKVTAFDQVE